MNKTRTITATLQSISTAIDAKTAVLTLTGAPLDFCAILASGDRVKVTAAIKTAICQACGAVNVDERKFDGSRLVYCKACGKTFDAGRDED